MKGRFCRGSILGDLSIEQIFQYYEEPLFFICANSEGEYFAMLTDFEPRRWLLVFVDKTTLSQLSRKKLPVRELFTRLHDKHDVFSVNETENGEFVVVQINKHDIVKEDLPEDDFYIEVIVNDQ